MSRLPFYKKCHKVKIKEIFAQQKPQSADELVSPSLMIVACAITSDLFNILLRCQYK